MNTTKHYNWLTRNGKMKKSTGTPIYNWGIPAIKCCPNAGICKKGCYANSGAYLFSNVSTVFDKRYELSLGVDFINTISAEITRRGIKKVRIHDSGDFYSLGYAVKWFLIAQKHRDVQFYAYTKMVKWFNNLMLVPVNLTIIYSYGGTEDNFINPDKHRHSRVFETVDQLLDNGYVDASNDDSVALNPDNHRIGLVYHGKKAYDNTDWGK
jgi:hypothetical protein